MFSKVNIGDWIMCTKSFKDWRKAGKWYQSQPGFSDSGNFYYQNDNACNIESTCEAGDFDLTNILTNEEYLKMARKSTFKDVNLGDWIMCTKDFGNQRTANKWYQRIFSCYDKLTNEFYYKPDDGTLRSATNKCSEFDLTKILTNDEYEAMIKNEKPKTHAPDVVNNPSHYTSGAIECIDAIRESLGKDGFIAFLRGQVAKYNWRLLHKGNPLQDAQKMEFYIKRLIIELEK